MSLKKPINSNYCGTIVSLKNIIILDNCDNVVHTNILGNLIIVSKTSKIGDIGIFFPIETKLSDEFLKNNNLYNKSEMNIDNTKKGFFEKNGRIRCQKFRGHKSEGFFIPLNSLDFTNHKEELKEGDEFDELNEIKICEKYINRKNIQSNTSNGNKAKKKLKRFERIISKYFNFHIDTKQLYKSIELLNKEDIIQISSKIHGTSSIASYIPVKRKLSLIEKFLKLFKVKIEETEYDYVYSSRKVIKNSEINPNKQDFYSEDIWTIAGNELKEYLQKGMTFYFEVVGYLPNGGYIQKDFDYGNEVGKHSNHIYRITYVNDDGKVFEFSSKQVQEFCKLNGLNAVKELYYGKVIDLYNILKVKYVEKYVALLGERESDFYHDILLELLKLEYLEKTVENNLSCEVPDEGIVIRVEKNDIDSYKLKSFKFMLKETDNLDKEIIDIEEQSEE